MIPTVVNTDIRKEVPLHCICVIIDSSSDNFDYINTIGFEPYEIIDVNRIKYDILGNSSRTDITGFAWAELYRRLQQKIGFGERAVIMDTGFRSSNRRKIISIAQKFGVKVYYIVKDISNVNTLTDDYQNKHNERDILNGDGYADVIDIRTSMDIKIIKKPIYHNMLSYINGMGFDGVTVVGDVHGNVSSMYNTIRWATSRNKYMVFLGDIIDYGPKSLDCIEEVYKVVVTGKGSMIIGNHERKIDRWMNPSNKNNIDFKLSEGNKVTVNAIEKLPADKREIIETKFKTIMNLSSHHLVIGKSMFAHAAINPTLWTLFDQRLMGKLENTVLFGASEHLGITYGKDSEYTPTTFPWVNDIPANHIVFVGHLTRGVDRPFEEVNPENGRAIFMDCGSGKGGVLFSSDIVYENDIPIVQTYVKN